MRLPERLCRLERDLRASFIRCERHGRVHAGEVIRAWKGKPHGQGLAIFLSRERRDLLLRALLHVDGNGGIGGDVPQDAVDILLPNGLVEGIEKEVHGFSGQMELRLGGRRRRVRRYGIDLGRHRLGGEEACRQAMASQ